MLYKQSRHRVSTADLNKLLQLALERNPPPLHRNRRAKIYYATQVGIEPPTIVLFCNEPNALSNNYRRYLLGVFPRPLAFWRDSDQVVPCENAKARRVTKNRTMPGRTKKPTRPDGVAWFFICRA